ncbi:hypothetical protein HG535_0G00710 [Zygotorulaspora mrakii]|uniref:Uncharacterized protein n=1 Tax=Zygotorulaspora mrakii TaxID=42260 RepID=A0A7H9B6I9_ZYGMR|nr:uncharacterized protein HG535_0G00710 [Zygotorulaspora mrakii]QLG74187.1 hypothetical protein HG535_0G00710 [Zygotorulaspora mrakii]
MRRQEGTLVILLKDYKCPAIPPTNVYFVLKFGKRCVRFNGHSGEMVLELDYSDLESPLEVFMFQRRNGKGISTATRRRQLVDKTSSFIFEFPYTTKTETLTEWQSFEVEFFNYQILLLFDIEFYPRSPMLPAKEGNQEADGLTFEKKPNNMSTSSDQNGPPQRKAQRNTPDSEKFKQNRSKKRNHFRIPLISNLVRDSSTRRTKENSDYDGTIFYDLDVQSGVKASFNGYKHGSSINSQSLLSPMSSGELYKYIKVNQQKPVKDDQLTMDVSPQDYFKYTGNRLAHDQNLNFVNMFSSDNVRLTGYLGAGRWDKKVISEVFINWYLRCDTKPINSPQLPPKCPLGMLWEEYYLINREGYIHDVLR